MPTGFGYPQRGFAILEVSKITNIKSQISNKLQHAAQAPALRVTEIRKSKQCLVREGFGH